MKNETIEVLEKNKTEKNVKKNTTEGSGCCPGAPPKNEDTCCNLDEEKKAEGESGCGCNTSNTKSKSSCC